MAQVCVCVLAWVNKNAWHYRRNLISEESRNYWMKFQLKNMKTSFLAWNKKFQQRRLQTIVATVVKNAVEVPLFPHPLSWILSKFCDGKVKI